MPSNTRIAEQAVPPLPVSRGAMMDPLTAQQLSSAQTPPTGHTNLTADSSSPQ
jgi:hypothetical protein